jgi:hypothetical protein
MARVVPAGSFLSGLCPAHCRACPAGNIFPTNMRQDSSGLLARTIGTSELVGVSVCLDDPADWEVIHVDAYCDDVVDLNPHARPLTFAQCQFAVISERECSDTLVSNIARNPAGSGARHPTDHFLCRCARRRPQASNAAACRRPRPAATGVDVYRCQRGTSALGPSSCTTENRHGRHIGSAAEGSRCVFPFVWRGTVHYECTADDGIRGCVDEEPPWQAARSVPSDSQGEVGYTWDSVDCASWAATNCAGGHVGWWVRATAVPTDRFGRRADQVGTVPLTNLGASLLRTCMHLYSRIRTGIAPPMRLRSVDPIS